jgi:hypothetical protein
MAFLVRDACASSGSTGTPASTRALAPSPQAAMPDTRDTHRPDAGTPAVERSTGSPGEHESGFAHASGAPPRDLAQRPTCGPAWSGVNKVLPVIAHLTPRRSGATMLPPVLRPRLQTVAVVRREYHSLGARPCESGRGRRGLWGRSAASGSSPSHPPGPGPRGRLLSWAKHSRRIGAPRNRDAAVGIVARGPARRRAYDRIRGNAIAKHGRRAGAVGYRTTHW